MNTNARSSRYTNLALTAIAVLLGVNLLKPDFVSSALAQPGENQTLASAAEQRKQMIAQLTSIEKKIERMDATLAKGIKVTDMPELKLPTELKDAMRAAARADKSEKTEKPERTAAEGAPVR